jgi:hypothetical protein
MSQLFVKIRLRGNGSKYRKLLDTDKYLFPESEKVIQNSIHYHPQTLLDEGEWFSIALFSQTEYVIDIIQNKFDTVDFATLKSDEINKVDYLFVEEQGELYFQNVGKSRLVRRKAVMHMGGNFKYDEGVMTIVLNEFPDAIYVRATDILYFRRLSAITGIFRGIDQLYREATESETKDFLNESFITLKNDYSYKHVKTANRKKIALAVDTLSRLRKPERQQIFAYIETYCPELKRINDSFEIGSEENLKMLLWGIEQRFFTTPVGNEKRIANSVITLK